MCEPRWIEIGGDIAKFVHEHGFEWPKYYPFSFQRPARDSQSTIEFDEVEEMVEEESKSDSEPEVVCTGEKIAPLKLVLDEPSVETPVASAPVNCKGRYDKWVFTFNNYSETSLGILKSFLSSECKWAIAAKEVGVGGTPHIQGTDLEPYFSFTVRGLCHCGHCSEEIHRHFF